MTFVGTQNKLILMSNTVSMTVNFHGIICRRLLLVAAMDRLSNPKKEEAVTE